MPTLPLTFPFGIPAVDRVLAELSQAFLLLSQLARNVDGALAFNCDKWG